MKKNLVILLIVPFCLFLGCQKKGPPLDQPLDHSTPSSESQELPVEAETHTHEDEELHIPKDLQEEWGIETEQVQISPISSQITLPGILTLNQNRTAHISSFVPGKISSLLVDMGSYVKPEQKLIKIHSPEFGQAKADFLEAWAKLNLSRQEYERAKRLFRDKAIEEKEYLRRKAEFEKDSTSYGARGSKLHSYGFDHDEIDALIEKCISLEDEEYKCEIAEPFLELLSPMAGTVIFRDAVIGEHVEAEKILLTISDLDILWAELEAYEKDIPFINKDSLVVVRSSLYPQRTFPGKILVIQDVIDKALRTVRIRVEVKNPDKLLKPNMFIQGQIENKEVKRILLTVPEEAIQNLNGEKIVFVLTGDGVYTARPVEIGQQIGDRRIITRGLIIGDTLVTKGAFSLKSELSKGTYGHSHVH